MKHLIYKVGKVNWWWAEELTVNEDHVQMIIQIHPDEQAILGNTKA